MVLALLGSLPFTHTRSDLPSTGCAGTITTELPLNLGGYLEAEFVPFDGQILAKTKILVKAHSAGKHRAGTFRGYFILHRDSADSRAA